MSEGKHNFWKFAGQSLPAWSMLLLGDPVRCSPVTNLDVPICALDHLILCELWCRCCCLRIKAHVEQGIANILLGELLDLELWLLLQQLSPQSCASRSSSLLQLWDTCSPTPRLVAQSGVAPANQTKERSVHELFTEAFRNKSSM